VRLVVLNGLLIACVALGVVGVQVLDRDEASVEASVGRYAAAITSGDLDSALAEISPGQRARWREWVRSQLLNAYDVRGIAVRAPTLLDRLLHGRPGGPFEVTTVLDVNRDFPEDFYQPTTRVPVEVVDGRPYLSAPLLAPHDELF
jgi:hypothetical protein